MGRFQPDISAPWARAASPRRWQHSFAPWPTTTAWPPWTKATRTIWPPRSGRRLEIALGEAGASEVVETALGDGHPETLLRRYLEQDFWKRHLQQYRKRPVYWLLQSQQRAFSVYVFHERATRDTLPLILGNRYVAGKINQLQNRMDEIQEEKKTAQGRKKKDLEKDAGGSGSESLLEVEPLQPPSGGAWSRRTSAARPWAGHLRSTTASSSTWLRCES